MIGSLCASCLVGCERVDYTTWSCQADPPSKLTSPMKLDGATMEFQGQQFKFCGSLGAVSYFDQTCPGTTEKSKVQFGIKTGQLVTEDRQYLCKLL